MQIDTLILLVQKDEKLTVGEKIILLDYLEKLKRILKEEQDVINATTLRRIFKKKLQPIEDDVAWQWLKNVFHLEELLEIIIAIAMAEINRQKSNSTYDNSYDDSYDDGPGM